MKIVPVFNLTNAIAGYDIYEDTVYYDRRLDHYPMLKEKVIAHEQYHAQNRLNLWKHLWNDVVGIGLLFDKEFVDYFVYEKDLKKQEYKWMLIWYGVLHIPISIITTMLMSVLIIFEVLVKMFKR